MRTIFINISNHPTTKWSSEQLDAIKGFPNVDKVVDIPFPQISPDADELDVLQQAEEMFNTIMGQYNNITEDIIFHIMGEMTFVYAFVSMAQKHFGYKCICVASTTERIVEEKDGVKISVFKFKRFRGYTAFYV